ncbi:MAG: ABC-F family ATP-binding cassette domain-containing protein [bacterium]|jgi:ATPase subunit of ABC transporter with duplicated ATPase domains/uncharacterized coiled-coil protein SlyX
MIAFASLTMNYGQKVLFEEASLNFDPGKRYGLVGANGVGKTTLLRLLSGEETPTSGVVSVPRDVRLGVLRQDHFHYEEESVLNVVLRGRPELWEALQEKEELLHTGKQDAETGHRLAELEGVIAEQDGYTAEPFASELLAGLGIGNAYHTGPMRALSGGFKLRVLLAQLLFRLPDVLMLDEPTNHLDIISIKWLENFLREQFQGTLIFISHDRQFLNAVATHIVDIDYQELRLYTGNYEQFLEAKLLNEEQKRKLIESQERKVAEMQAFVDRFRYKATKARQAQSRVKQMEKMEIPEIKRSSRIAPQLRFEQTRPSGKLVLRAKNLSKSFGDVSVLENVSLEIERGEKIALIGPNGIGKSTLLKLLLEKTAADAGQWEWGHEVSISYFAQDHHEQLQGAISAYEWLYQFAPQESVSFIRGMLGRVLLSGDEALKQAKSLSGGESARLLFARIMMEKRNVLVLDEPTNHLDLEGVEALADALERYPGTVLVVSHDRHFVRRIATHVLELTPEGARNFKGNYDEYLERFGDDYLSRDQGLSRTRESARSSTKPTSQADRRELRKQLTRMERELEKLEMRIADTEQEIEKLNTRFSETDFYQKTPGAKVRELEKYKSRLGKKLADDLQHWETASEKVEEARNLMEA